MQLPAPPSYLALDVPIMMVAHFHASLVCMFCLCVHNLIIFSQYLLLLLVRQVVCLNAGCPMSAVNNPRHHRGLLATHQGDVEDLKYQPSSFVSNKVSFHHTVSSMLHSQAYHLLPTLITTINFTFVKYDMKICSLAYKLGL